MDRIKNFFSKTDKSFLTFILKESGYNKDDGKCNFDVAVAELRIQLNDDEVQIVLCLWSHLDDVVLHYGAECGRELAAETFRVYRTRLALVLAYKELPDEELAAVMREAQQDWDCTLEHYLHLASRQCSRTAILKALVNHGFGISGTLTAALTAVLNADPVCFDVGSKRRRQQSGESSVYDQSSNAGDPGLSMLPPARPMRSPPSSLTDVTGIPRNGKPVSCGKNGYPINHGQRHNFCFVFNNPERRPGSILDVNKIRTTFESLRGFEVKTFDIKKEYDTMEQLQNIAEARQENYSQSDLIVVCIFSHGDAEYFHCTDNTKLSYYSVLEIFSARSAPSLAAIPKMFIFNCLLLNEDLNCGTNVSPLGPSNISDPIVPQCDVQLSLNRGNYFVLWSTIQGYKSGRTGNGSPFVQKLCAIIQSSTSSSCRKSVYEMCLEYNRNHYTFPYEGRQYGQLMEFLGTYCYDIYLDCAQPGICHRP